MNHYNSIYRAAPAIVLGEQFINIDAPEFSILLQGDSNNIIITTQFLDEHPIWEKISTQ